MIDDVYEENKRYKQGIGCSVEREFQENCLGRCPLQLWLQPRYSGREFRWES